MHTPSQSRRRLGDRLRAGLVVAAAAVALLAPSALSQDAPTEKSVAVKTERGPELSAVLHVPAAPNGTAVVLAPGQGYHKELPLMKRGAEALASAGFVALRFDWAYFTAEGQPSEDLSTEIADLDAAVKHVRALDGVKQVIVAGKSLGTFVAARYGIAHADELKGVALLTLPVNQPGKPDEPMDPEAAAAKLPFEALVVCGDQDPLADRGALYRFATTMAKPPQIVIVPGDHGFQPPSKDETEKLENVDLAVHALVVWAKRTAAR